MLKQYNELIKTEKKLHEDMKAFILNAIKANGGRITYKPQTDGDELSYDDKYPLITTFEDKHGGHYNVAITDVYIITDCIGQEMIYVDGIDTENNAEVKGSEMHLFIYSDKYSEISYFITYHLLKQIRSFAERLALKDLVDKYNKLPHQFFNDNGGIKNEYHNEKWDNIEKYIEKLEQLYIRCSEPNCDKHDINSDLMSYICILADLELVKQSQKLVEDLTLYDEEEDSYRYTEDAQDDFNGFYDEIEGELWGLMNFEGLD